ncbi:M1 family aminopeptidase [Bdellovibrionota bacterium FG-2]
MPSTSPSTSPSSFPRPDHKLSWALTQTEATFRSQVISKVIYNLRFRLGGESRDFEGYARIRFHYKRINDQVVWLDFEGGAIRQLTLNGVLDNQSRFDRHRIYFLAAELKEGENEVEIAFSHPYGRGSRDVRDDGGLVRIRDTNEGRIYLHSNLEPFFANRVFPCFDQPDLKARIELVVEAPQDWLVIANAPEQRVKKEEGRTLWTFQPTEVLSTYLFALHAGPFRMWKQSAETGIVLRLFARPSLADSLDVHEWFETTKKGFAYFTRAFGVPFPFQKYDQVIAPGFYGGGMENAAAPIFSESFVLDERSVRTETILHELSHMWFGDLVTPQWWNGLWLNESFATFAAEEAKGGGFSVSKRKAYWAEASSTAHSVDFAVADTELIQESFDDITYAKGAAVIRQLSFQLGEKVFREGVRKYLGKFAHGNANQDAFFRVLSAASGRDLGAWQRLWIQTPGANSLRAEWACKKNRISAFKLVQGSVLRPHRTTLLLLLPSKKTVTKDVFYSAKDTDFPELLGSVCPVFVFPNEMDRDYVKVEIDASSRAYLLGHLNEFKDVSLRRLVWFSLWDSVLEGNLTPADYLKIVLAQIREEMNPSVLAQVLETITGMPTVLSLLPPMEALRWRGQLEALVRGDFVSGKGWASGNADLGQVAFDFILDLSSTSFSADSVEVLKGVLLGKLPIRGWLLGAQHRWGILKALARAGYRDVYLLVDAELARDHTDRAQMEAQKVRAFFPDPQNRKFWFKSFREGASGRLRGALVDFQAAGEEDPLLTLVSEYFVELEKIFKSPVPEERQEWAFSLVKYLFPPSCDGGVVKKTRIFLDAHPDLPKLVRTSLELSRENVERCVRIRGKALAAGLVPQL